MKSEHLIILGAQKAGTTSLHRYLVQHPQIFQSQNKEMCFFTSVNLYSKGLNWYKGQFQKSMKNILKLNLPGKFPKYLIDSTPEYLYHHNVPALIKKNLGERVKMIILLREPVERAFSAYKMFRKFHENPEAHRWVGKDEILAGQSLIRKLLLDEERFPSFSEILNIEYRWILANDQEIVEPSFIRRGFYYEQIQRYFDLFDRSQIKIIPSTLLKVNTSGVLEKIFKWLDLEHSSVPKMSIEKNYNKSQNTEKMLESDRLFLDKIYATPNQKLFDLLKQEVLW